MLQIRSAGVLVFRRRPTSFLLMGRGRRFDLPKGHVEAGETDLQGALRELWEETGIAADNIELDADFRHTLVYYPRYYRLGGRRVEKTLTVYLAWLIHDQPVLMTEHDSHQWVDWRPPHAVQRETIDPLLASAQAWFLSRPDRYHGQP